MKIQYIECPKINEYENELLTYGKEYEVIADYRKRRSGQKIADNGLVIKNDKNELQMVFLSEFAITCNDTSDTYVFSY